MPSQHATRRQVLRSLGTAATAVAAGTSGCVDGILRTGPQSGEASSTPPASGVRPYLSFSAIPEGFGFEGSYRFTSIRPSIVEDNKHIFGPTYLTFSQRWMRLDHVVPFANQHLAVSVRFMTAILADYERDFVERHYENRGLEYQSSHRGVSLYGGTLLGYTQQAIGVGDDVIYIQGMGGIAEGRRKIKHLIDVQEGVITPYFEQAPRYDAVTSHLPQGVYTRVHPQVPIEDIWISDYDVIASGETLLLETDRHPAEGRTVLQFHPSVSDPLAQTEGILEKHDRLIQFPMTDPTISQPAPGTVVLTDSVDPANVF